MNLLDAAVEVLRDAGTEGLHYKEITTRILSRGLWTTRGKTPWDTLTAQLSVDIRKHGDDSRFRRVSAGIYALNMEHLEKPPSLTLPQEPAPSQPSATGLTAAATRAAGAMNFPDAAARVLRKSGSSEPMHYEAITERAIAEGFIRPEGRTPAASLNAQIGSDIRRREERGEQPLFVRHERGLIGLADWQPQTLANEIAARNREVRAELLKRAKKGSPEEFENLIGTLLVKMGFEDVEVTSPQRDGGIDVLGTLVVGNMIRIHMAVQAKRWKANVQAPVVQQLRGSLVKLKLGQGLIITTSDFSKGACDEAADASYPIALVNGEQLADLLAEHKVGVERERHTLLRLLEPDEEP